MVIEELARQIKFSNWKINLKFNTSITQGIFNNEKIILAKPQTFMNNSGLSVKSLSDYYKISPEEILVIHDDIDLPLGEIRIQKKRGSAGHKGVQSIIEHLGTKNFIRIRIGIKSGIRNQESGIIDTEKFVLQKFTKDEEKIIQTTIKKGAALIADAL